ncbi:hypothetical protein N9C53_01560 [bacterium]|nr:hypothetical protein [bacterium]
MGATYTRQSASAIVDGGVIEASDINAEFNQVLAAFAVTSGHTHDGTAAEGGPITKLLGTAITIGDATAGTDIALTFDGESNDGVVTWMEDEDYFQFSDDLLLTTTEKLQFRDTAIYINSSADGQLDLVADTEIQIAATTVDINGAVDISGALTLAGTTLAETISDTVGAMVSSNTETGITVTYDDADNTLDFVLGAAQTTITSLLATDIKIGEDDQTKIDFETADEIHFYAANVEQVYLGDNIFGPQSDSDVDLGSTGVRWKDAFIDTITTTGNITIGGDLTVSGDDITMGTNTAGNLLVADGTNFNSIAVSSLSEIGTAASDDVFIAIDTSGGGLKKITRSSIIAGTGSSGDLANVVEDTSPQLGGNLDMNGADIITTSNATIDLAPNGTGTVVVRGNTNSGAIVFNCESNSHGQTVIAQPHSAGVTNTMLLPAGANSTLVSLVSTDTLTNKTLTSPKINEDVAVTSTATELNILDGVTSTTAELNILDGATVVVGEINALDLGATAIGTAIASKAVVLDANKDYTGLRNFTVTGELDAATGDFSGDVDVDGTLEADAITINGTAIDSVLSPIAGGSGIVTTGALNSGSITSGFGTINTGASAITTTGLISGGSLDIDNVLINGTTIGHTDDTDLITLADGIVTVAGEVQMTTLDIGGTNVTSTAAELNYSDLATLGTTAASKVFTADGNNLTKVSGAVLNTEDTLSDGANIAWNVINSPVAKVTLGGNRNLSAPSGSTPAAGQFVSLLVIQDGTGSRTLTFNAVYEFTTDTAPTLTATANLGDVFVFRYNGSKWLEVGRNLALTLS